MGNSTDIDDLIAPRARRRPNGMTYDPLAVPDDPKPGGIWERRRQKGKNLGKTCLVCNDELKYKGGRPRIICGKKGCFRAYRNMYRKDYDSAHPE